MMCTTPLETTPGVPELSVIVPTRNEAGTIGKTLEALLVGASERRLELIVADGSSEDNTRDIARSMGAAVVTSEPGRARQMNAGAAVATGDHLLFLHADTLVPVDYHRLIRETLAHPGVVGGAFQLHIDASNRSLRVIEWCVNLRSRWFSMPYGDQGLFMRDDIFAQLGGFADLPVMEDYDLVRRLGGLGRIRLAPTSVKTSARRWLHQGIICATMTNQACIIGYHLGVKPSRLAMWRNARCIRTKEIQQQDYDANSHHGSGGADRQRSAQATGR